MSRPVSYTHLEFGRVLTLDGNVMLTERDEFIYDEMIVHVPMAVHREAKDILVIGAGDGGVVRELTRYDRVERIDLVEMDPQVVEACRAYLPGNACRMDDRRVHIYFENALKFIRQCEEEYDLIIVDSSDPFGPSEGLFTREFYGSCFNALKEDGIMVNQQGSPFYAEDANACLLYTSLLKAEPNGAPYGVQIFGEVPEIMGQAAAAVEQYAFDFLDSV